VNSVEDKHAVGTLNAVKGAASGHWAAEAAAAVAELLGPGTSVPVEVSIKCRGLPDKDTFSKSDPMAVLLIADSSSPHSKQWVEVDRSDVVANNLSEWGALRPAAPPVARLHVRTSALGLRQAACTSCASSTPRFTLAAAPLLQIPTSPLPYASHTTLSGCRRCA
jgi:hypothetical protein